MILQELANHKGFVAFGIAGAAVLFAQYARTLVPRAGDKIKPFDTPELKALRPPIESLMENCGVKPVRDRDVA